jgi:two-component system chemotaxis response regulator CheY
MAARKNRAENIVMVADDDMFMRSLVHKNFKDRAQIIEHGDAGTIVESYLEMLPDILFLDIHLPGGSGVEILSELTSFDDTAHVIIISSDSVKDNVLEARKLGAKGFVAKPFTPEKLDACYEKCPTIKPAKAQTGA